MNFEKFPPPDSLESSALLNDQKIIKKGRFKKTFPEKNTHDKALSRRKFLKLGALALTGAMIPEITEKTLDFFSSQENENSSNQENPTSEQTRIHQDNESLVAESLEELREELYQENKANSPSLKEIFSFDNPQPITLSPEKIKEKIEHKWLKYYGKEGRLRPDLERGFHNMQPWIGEIKKCFHREGVPEKFAYLAIPESHFTINAHSPTGARGPYQFMKNTATNKICQLLVSNTIDERYDPIRSAEAAAKNLKYLYNQCFDWDLALSGYNGAFIWKYFSKVRNKKERTYPGFIKFLENSANETKEQLQTTDFFPYTVVPKDTLEKIAKRFKISNSAILKEANELSSSSILIGQKLKIPLNNHATKLYLYDKLVNPTGIKENLNYPGKFNAVFKIINSGDLDNLKTTNRLKFVEKKIPPQGKKIVNYLIKNGDSLFAIGKKFKLPYKKIIAENHLKNSSIKAGQRIRINLSHPNQTLISLAKTTSRLNLLKSLNPAIIDPHAPLPANFIVRL